MKPDHDTDKPSTDDSGAKVSWKGHLAAATAFFTIVPVTARFLPDHPQAWPFVPLVGGAIGIVAGLTFAIVVTLGVPSLAAAALATGIAGIIGGFLHEDGLADTADGLMVPGDRQRRLEVMRDSRVGTGAVIGLILVIILRIAALGALAPGAAIAAFVAAEAGSRTSLAVMLTGSTPARADGLGSAVRVTPNIAGITVLTGAAILILALGIGLGPIPGILGALVAMVLSGLIVIGSIAVAQRMFGGYTGDTLGATQQLLAALILLVIATVA